MPEQKHLRGMKCADCGGPHKKGSKQDENVKRRMGCSSPPRRPHELVMGDTTLTLNQCPRKLMKPYLKYNTWYRHSCRGALHLDFPPEDTPFHVIEAIDVIEIELENKEEYHARKERERIEARRG